MIVFSATIPSWLKTSVSRYMSSEKISFINLIEDSQEKTAKNVEHLCVKLNDVRQRAPLVLSLFEKYSSEGQAIVFCQTKHECDLLVRSNQINSYPSAVLHGDLSQNKREQVLKVHNFALSLARLSSLLSGVSTRRHPSLDHHGHFGTRLGHSSDRPGYSHLSASGSFVLRSHLCLEWFLSAD